MPLGSARDLSFPLNFRSGRLALDFLNTQHFSRGVRVDSIAGPGALMHWFADNDLAHGPAWTTFAASLPVQRLVGSQAHRFRSALHEAITAFGAEAALSPWAIDDLSRVLEVSRRATSLRWAGPGNGRVQFHDTEMAEGPRALLVPIARSAAELLADADPARIRRCRADDCALWFIDTSKGGRRHWCSMARCGNRAKARRHYQKSLSSE